MLKVVLDTSVVVAGLRTRLGAGNAVLRLVADHRIRLLATPPLFLEYEDVLKRPEHRLAHGLTPLEIDEFLAELAAGRGAQLLHCRSLGAATGGRLVGRLLLGFRWSSGLLGSRGLA